MGRWSELLTDRLRLRWMTEEDAGLMLAIWNDPAFIRFVTDRGIRTEPEARQAMHDGILELYAVHGYGPYLLEPLAGGAPLGICGLFKRDNLAQPDIGYALLPAFRGQGYALEAARRVLIHARDDLALEQLLAIVAPGNAVSIRLLEKLGMRFKKPLHMPGDDSDVALYGVQLADTGHST